MGVTYFEILDAARRYVILPSEVDWRSAASRAYYAAYHAARELVGLCPENAHFHIEAGTHGKLIDRFEIYAHADRGRQLRVRTIGYVLRDMKTKRELADYSLKLAFELRVAQAQINQFQKVLNGLEILKTAP